MVFKPRPLLPVLVTAALLSPRSLRAAEPPPATATATAEPGSAPEMTPPESGDGDNDMRGKAMEAYRRGEAAYKEKRYEEALAAFQEASSFYASPDFQYNIGRCYENLQRYEDAVRSYEIYLRASPEAADSGDVRERIGRLRGLLEAQKAEAEQREKEAAKQPVAVPAQPVDEPPPPGRPLVITGAVLTGIGAALAIGGGVGFGVVAADRSTELDDIQTGGNPDDATLADAQTVEDEGRRAEVGQIAMAAGGGALAVAGIALLAVGLVKNKNARASGTTTRIVPALNRRSAGLVLTGRF